MASDLRSLLHSELSEPKCLSQNVIQNSVCLKNLTEAIEGKASPHYEMNMEHGQNERLDSDSGIAGTLKPEYWEGKEDEDEWCSEIFTIIYLHLPTFTNHET